VSRSRRWLWLWFVVFLSLPARAASLAEGFTRLPEGAVVLLMPPDIELFSVSAGGILEPQAEWTERAHANLRQAFLTRSSALKVNFMPLPGEVDEVVDSLNRLHGAVGQAIAMHHSGLFALPTKEGRLDWSLGDEAALMRARTGADYALFAFVRDSYASGERVAMMVVGAGRRCPARRRPGRRHAGRLRVAGRSGHRTRGLVQYPAAAVRRPARAGEGT